MITDLLVYLHEFKRFKMKKMYLGIALLLVALTSCSTDGSNPTSSTTTYFPLTPTSDWVYDVKLDTQNAGRDSLYVNGETTINDKVYQKLKTKATPLGFYSTVLNNNNVRIDSDQVLLSGTSGLGLSDILPISLELSDFVIFKQNATNNAELSAISGTIEQNLGGFPLVIEYKLTSVFKETLSTFTVPGRLTYQNVKVIKINTNLKVSTIYLLPVLNTPISIPILAPQNVVVSTHYYAEGVGMIYAKTDINYQLSELPQGAGELPIPQQGSSSSEEFLD